MLTALVLLCLVPPAFAILGAAFFAEALNSATRGADYGRGE